MTRNSEVLADFVKYCQEHPEERFWQAIKNWSGYYRIYASDNQMFGNMKNTFYWEGKTQDD